MNTNSQIKIAPQGLQMTCLDIPSENGCFFVTIFLFQKHSWSTLWKAPVNNMRFSLLQGVHWEGKPFAQGTMHLPVG